MLLLATLALAVPPSRPGDITLTEFQADPAAVPEYWGEWIELRNNAGTLDVNGVTLTLENGATLTIADTALLGVKDYLVLGVDGDTSRNGNVTLDVVYAFADFNLSSSDDAITISYSGVILDVVAWDASWGVVADAAESCAPNAADLEWANDLAINWCPSTTLMSTSGMYGSPRAANPYCTASPPGIDNDGDGFTEAEGDCDDADADVSPGAVDGDASPYGNADDDGDCDGVRDDGVTDDDADGWSEVDGDCDDERADVYPGGTETSDGQDGDCDGCIDDDDDDGDAWTECPESDGRYDCMDTDAGVNPDATEILYDGIDEDCDGLDDDCDADGDHYEAVSAYGAGCDGHDCDDADGAVHPGAPEIADNGIDDDCDGTVDAPVVDTAGDTAGDTGEEEGKADDEDDDGKTSGWLCGTTGASGGPALGLMAVSVLLLRRPRHRL